MTRPHAQSFRSGWILRIFTSDSFLGDATAVGSGTTVSRTTGVNQASPTKGSDCEGVIFSRLPSSSSQPTQGHSFSIPLFFS